MKRFIYAVMMVMMFGLMAGTVSAAGKVEVKQRFYSTSDDGVLHANNTNWASAMNGSNQQNFMTDASRGDIRVSNWYGGKTIQRPYLPFDTNGMPSNITILSVDLNYYIINGIAGTLGNDGWYLTKGSSTWSTFTGYNTDFSNGIFRITTSGAYMTLSLNADGIANINTSGISEFGLRQYYDFHNVEPGGNADKSDNFSAYFSEEAGTDYDPYLEVTYICNDVDAPVVGGDVISVTPITYVEVVEKFYPSLDGSIASTDQSPWSSWSVIRDAVGMDLYIDSTPDIGICVRMATGQTSNTYTDVRRGEFIFDASSIPDYATLTAGKISLYGESKYDDNSYVPIIELVSSNPASETAFAASVADFTSFGTIRLATGISFNDWNISGYNDFVLNQAGIESISIAGLSKFGTIANYDLDGTAPASPGSEKTYNIRAYMSGHVGTDQDPYLEVTYRCKQSDAPAVGGNVISVTEVIEEPIGQATSISGDILQCATVSDINSNGAPEIVVLGSDVNGIPIVCKIDAGTGNLIGDVSFHSTGWVAKSVTVLPDQNSNGSEEISVLAIDPSAGDVETEMKDSSTDAVVGGVILP